MEKKLSKEEFEDLKESQTEEFDKVLSELSNLLSISKNKRTPEEKSRCKVLGKIVKKRLGLKGKQKRKYKKLKKEIKRLEIKLFGENHLNKEYGI